VRSALSNAPAGIFDIVDDEPLANRDAMRAIAKAVGKQSLWPLPKFALRWSVGSELMEVLSRNQRISNQRFKDATGWVPQTPSARLGWPLITEGRSGQAS
jgi:nucleoside-diphosphate-sugar epimerase